ncbi:MULTISPECIES: penicillin-binding protein 2 [Agromyces]|uniref:Cell division protein FtsI n=1 Tax=Agromyces mediolanus TaxID=41986 RepID=A0A918CCX6_AGRME|nr:MULTISPECIES: penicillin-binding protein 2 [Agromyces]MCD1571222.1 penicillin-binding protein 2 [Agromyces mediolanus]GGR17300.1 cell division protein FtsI [Agromyces mediolanus]GLJ71626.1 cell division protein FtsI [Agromyces mediolanus]GLU88080.1 cell division protein FtsI [Agromyces sp. NBRC 114283]
MNRELKRITILVFVMFLSLFVASTIVQYAQAEALANDPRNSRTLYESYSVERGPILVGGEPIAYSQPSDDDYKFQRVYANGPLYAPITGFLPVNGEATGLERSLNSYLSGQSSTQFFDQLNRLISGQDPMGASVEVAIDPVAQQAAWDALGDYTGAVIVTEPSTGRIIAMVTKPTYDPNSLAVHNSGEVQDTYQALLDDPSDPLYNRATGGDMNPPGSVFKLVVTAAALESGQYTPDSTFPNPAELTLPGTNSVVRNTDGGTCGGGAQVTLADALRLSCNIPFAELGMALGDDAIREQAEKFGFDSEFDIPTATEPSTYPRALDEPQTALTAFGQGDVRATPLQMAMVSAAIANGGIVMNPNLVDQITAPDFTPLQEFQKSEFGRAISKQTADTMVQMMVNGVENGAASNARIDGVSVAGKTGTAENGESDPYTLWFTGFAPADAPQYAITVLVEDGGGQGQEGFGNGIAAPVAKQVLEAVLNK